MGINTTKEIKRLENIKNQLEELKEKQREAEAEKKMIMKKLKDDYECSSVEEAESYLEELEGEIEKMENEINEKTEKLLSEMKKEGLI